MSDCQKGCCGPEVKVCQKGSVPLAVQKYFHDLTPPEKQDLVQKIGCLLKEHDIDARIVVQQEMVCDIRAPNIHSKSFLQILKELPANQAEQAKSFKAAAMELIKDLGGVMITVKANVCLGD